MKNFVFAVEKADKRMEYLSDLLKSEGFSVSDDGNVFCFSPARKFETAELENLPPNSVMASGKLSFEQLMLLSEKNIRHINLVADEIFTVQNAILTAEAAFSLIVQNTESSVYSEKILVVGFGRLGKALAKLFSALGLDFAVATSPPSERAEAKLFTEKTCTADCVLSYYDVIINTVPAEIIPRENLEEIKKDCLFLELASTPGIAESAEKHFKHITAHGLPGKYCPKAAAEILKQALLKEVNL